MSAAEGTRRVSDLVAEVLARLGVGHVFGVVGSGNFHVTNALIAAGVPFTAARHEGGAATMADAYARQSGRLGVVTTHQGCGFTNALTGIGEAAKSRTPMLVLTADTQAAAIRSNFRIDQDAAARSVGAVAERLHSPGSAVADTVRAWRTAMRERRTVVFSLPLDVQAAQVTADVWDAALASVAPISEAAPVRPTAEATAQLADELLAAKRPVFVAGRGAKHAGPELRMLAQQVGALVAEGAVVKGLFTDDPANLGISGGFSSPTTAELIAGADLIVGWGCAMNMWTMRHGMLVSADARVVQIDHVDAALGATRPIDLGVLGDTALTAAEVLGVVRERQAEPRVGYRSDEVLDRIRVSSRWADVATPDLSTDSAIDPREISKLVNAALPAERVVSIDSGNFMGYPSQYLDVPDADGFCFTQAFQAIGLGLGTAIGAAIAQPHRLPVLGTGDGGFLMGISELETAVRQRIPLIVLVYNDAAYGAEVHHFRDGDAEVAVDSVVFPDTDIAAIARGFGTEGLTVRTAGDFAAVRAAIAQRAPGEPGVPLVIDAKIASDGGAWWLAEAFKGH